ncbi:MAG: sugar kinase [Anaerolineae bacterium]|nr:sugar kinase [Anaerolineae bacterium]
MSRFDVTAVGETMLRLSVPSGERLEAAASLDMVVGGAESNVLAALSRLDRSCGYCTALPDNPLGRRVANALRETGINLQMVQWKPRGRVGLYFIEFAEPPRSIQVIYDRADSCAAALALDSAALAELCDTRLLHVTGITPGVSVELRELTRQAFHKARQQGTAISFDVNYRSRLWPVDEAASTLQEFANGVDILFCKEADARLIFGCDGSSYEIILDLAKKTGALTVVMTVGALGVYALQSGQVLYQPAMPVIMVDRIGAGDALAAGVLHGWLDGDLLRGMQYGTAMAALVMGQFGDMLRTNAAEVEHILSAPQPHIQR